MADVGLDELRARMQARACGMGMPEADADVVVDHFIDAEMRGATGHGVERLRWLAGRAGDENRGSLRLLERAEGCARYDGAGMLGYVALMRALEIELADPPAGARLVAVSHCFPTGRLGHYAERVAERGLACVIIATSTARIVHPGGGRPMLGTNPICLGLPGDPSPTVVDVSMGAVTYGAVLKASAEGRSLPDGVAAAADGSAELDPDAITDGRAGILPFGGELAHKGFALALVVELLCGALAGLDGHSAVALLASPVAAPADALRTGLDGRRFPGDRGAAAFHAARDRGRVIIPDDLWEWLGAR
ncbi:MAG: Ldh family oxidoreductase [Gaiellales bacterium]